LPQRVSKYTAAARRAYSTTTLHYRDCDGLLRVQVRCEGPFLGRPAHRRAWPGTALKGRTRRLHRGLVNGRNRRISPVAAHSGDCLLSERIAGTQPWRREPLFLPLSGHSPAPQGSAQEGGNRPMVLRQPNGVSATIPNLPASPGNRGFVIEVWPSLARAAVAGGALIRSRSVLPYREAGARRRRQWPRSATGWVSLVLTYQVIRGQINLGWMAAPSLKPARSPRKKQPRRRGTHERPAMTRQRQDPEHSYYRRRPKGVILASQGREAGERLRATNKFSRIAPCAHEYRATRVY
jgi:hypothetical protein